MRVRPLLSNFVVAGVAFGSLSAGSTAALAACDGPLHLKCARINTTQAQSQAVASGGQQYGFNDNSLTNKQLPRATVLAKLQDAGAHYLRQPMSWQFYEKQPGVYSATFFTQHDRDYNELLARGVHPVIMLLGTPNWAVSPLGRGAASPDGNFRCDNSSAPCLAPPDISRSQVLTQWQHFVRVVANRYPKAGAIEVWNEPNIQSFWLQPQDPALYAHLLQMTMTAVRQVNSSIPVITGSTANFYGTNSSTNTAADDFLRTVYKTVGASAFNGIGFHYYACSTSASDVTERANRDISWLRQVRNDFKDTSKEFWLTETGATSSGNENANCGAGAFTEQQQASALGTILNWAKSQNSARGDLPVVLVHTLFISRSRTVINKPLKAGHYEFGVVAYSYDSTTDHTTVQNKPAYATVRCKMLSSC
jgi:hypothetical protein